MYQFDHTLVSWEAYVIRYRMVRVIDIAAVFFGYADLTAYLFLQFFISAVSHYADIDPAHEGDLITVFAFQFDNVHPCLNL